MRVAVNPTQIESKSKTLGPFVRRQCSQILAALLLGLLTSVFLYTVYVFRLALEDVHDTALLAYFTLFVAYSVGGSISLGHLARYAFIRHMKQLEDDLGLRRATPSRELVGQRGSLT
ncbi:hypothetical protein [Limnobacter sp.]|uniref:hypothetical protein n=1 Tax=Limnobacter sp. TaxID=2003368 RepID=UPI0035189C65